MGVVYMAEQKQPVKRRVALKILPQSLAAEAKFSAYFESEAKALAALTGVMVSERYREPRFSERARVT